MDIRGIRFCRINLNHCSDANSALEDFCNGNSIDIFLVQDPYIYDGSIAGIPSHWRSFTSLTLSSAIIITNKVYFVIECIKLDNSTFISLTVLNDILTIGSQYTRPYPNGDLDKDIQYW